MNGHTRAPLAYLIGRYPAVRHTFIFREIATLRGLGFQIHTASVNFAERPPEGFTDAELSEVARTFYVKEQGLRTVLYDHVTCAVRWPVRYMGGLLLAVRLGDLDLRALIFHLLYFGEAVVVGEWLRRNHIEHLHVHFANASATVALLIRRIYGIPYSMTVHGPDEFYDATSYRLRQKVAGASLVACISNFTRSQLMKLCPPVDWGKLILCPLGVDSDLFKPGAKTERKMLSILCTAGLVRPKGQAILLAAVAQLKARGWQLRLSLAGDGPDRQLLEKMAARLNLAQDVTFHGAIRQDRIREFLECADIFVLASFAEGVPVCLMEAMSMELPCVSTYIAGIPELIESGEDGILVPASNDLLLADTIEKLLKDPQIRTRIGRAARRKVIEKYDLRRNVEALAAAFDTLPFAKERAR
jgi:glycosyltransferase involved in cell wall biosynthesis